MKLRLEIHQNMEIEMWDLGASCLNLGTMQYQCSRAIMRSNLELGIDVAIFRKPTPIRIAEPLILLSRRLGAPELPGL